MNTTNVAVLCILIAAMAVASRVATGTQFTGATAAQLHAIACEAPAKSDSPWNIKNLYDCANGTLHVPDQLRIGPRRDVAKDAACNFPVGPGWALSVRRTCGDSEIAITAIMLNGRNELESIEFARWVDETYDSSYRFAASVGLTETLSR